MSDEAWFHVSGNVNAQNSRIWDTENPHVLHQRPLHDKSGCVVCSECSKSDRSDIFWEHSELRQVKGKGKGVPLHAMQEYGGRGGIAPTHT
jgi:hypothetical protein